MANKILFREHGIAKRVKPTDTINEAGGVAYSFTTQHALAQYCVTGTFSNTFYASAEEQLGKIIGLLEECNPPFIAKMAVYAHCVAKMKDTPCYALAWLTANGHVNLLQRWVILNGRTDSVFNHVMSNGKMLSNYVNMIRSGSLGRKSLGYAPKRLIQNWLNTKDPYKLWRTSIGVANPSIADIIKMVHPRPFTPIQENMYGYLIGRDFQLGFLPEDVRKFEYLKNGIETEIPSVDFRALTNCKLTKEQWKQVARQMPFTALRMNLNHLGRHGIFDDDGLVTDLANKLSDPDEIKKANVFPYQLLTAYQNTREIPMKLSLALQDALEIATENVPQFSGKTAVLVDVSGSMGSSITGSRPGSTSVTRCVEVAALVAACVLRNNENTVVVQFDTSARELRLNPRDSVMTNAKSIVCNGGGTNISCGLQYIHDHHRDITNIIIVSDNESWMSNRTYQLYYNRGTSSSTIFEQIRARNPKAKLVNIDLQAYASTQVPDAKQSVLNIGGASDSIFSVIANFFNNKDINFVDEINTTILM